MTYKTHKVKNQRPIYYYYYYYFIIITIGLFHCDTIENTLIYHQERWPSGLGVNAGALGPMFDSKWANCGIFAYN